MATTAFSAILNLEIKFIGHQSTEKDEDHFE